MDIKQNLRRKRFIVSLLNFATSGALSIVLFYETMKTNISLIVNWICRADLAERVSIYGHSESFDEDFNMLVEELQTISQSSAYANILVNANLLVSVIIMILVSLFILVLAWLCWQNFKRFLVSARDLVKGK